MITIETSLIRGSSIPMCLAARHEESGLTGHAFRGREGNEDLWRAFREAELDNVGLDISEWPQLQEMRHEALQLLVDKAELAQNIHHEAVGILDGVKP